MAKELINCLDLLHEKFAGEQINRGFKQYIELAEFIARNYDDSLTRAELEDRYPWIRFMTEVEQEGLLERAKRIRRRDRRKGLAENPTAWKIKIEKAIQAELDRRTEIEKQAVTAISACDFKRANELISSLDDGILKGLMHEFESVSRKLAEK